MSTNTTLYRREAISTAVLLGCLLLLSPPVWSQTTPEPQDVASVFHSPAPTWAAGIDHVVMVDINRDWELEGAHVAVRAYGSDASFDRFPLQRWGQDHFAAQVPGELVQPPGVEYYISSTIGSGGEHHHFASSESPYPVQVEGETELTRQADRLARHNGNRSELTLSGTWTQYGRRQLPDGRTTDPNTDLYWTSEIEYRYRFLETLYDIHFGLTFLRGHTPTYTRGGVTENVNGAAASPGINLGSGGVMLEAGRYFSTELDLLLGASDVGFAAGFSALVRIGRIADTRGELAVTVIGDIGTMARFTFAWHTIERVPMDFSVELDGRPDDEVDALGTRLILGVGFEATDHLTIHAHGGYATRTGAYNGGPVVGLTLSYGF